jgi:IclR family mhp operon transcriptional activator
MGHVEQDYRGITRTLQVLTALNGANGSSLTAISRLTGISRPALYRILAALMKAGYIRRRDGDRLFFLTSKVRMLSAGFTDPPASDPPYEATPIW